MKFKVVLFDIVCLFAFLGTFSSPCKKEVPISQNISDSIFYHTWYVNITSNLKVKTITPLEAMNTLTLNKEKTFILKAENVSEGTWNFNASSQLLTLNFKKEIVRLKLVSLDSKSIVFEKLDGDGSSRKVYLTRPIL